MSSRTRWNIMVEIEKLHAVDVHSHLVAQKLSAQKLSDVLGYHMLHYPLSSVGWKGAQKQADDQESLEGMLSYLPRASNTAFFSYLRRILAELYNFKGDLDADTLPRLAELFNQVSTRDRAGEIVRQMRLVRSISMNERSKDNELLAKACEAETFSFREGPQNAARMIEDARRTKGGSPQESLKLWARQRLEKIDVLSLVTLGSWISGWADCRKPTPAALRAVFKRSAKHEFTPDEESVIGSARLHALLDEYVRRGGKHMQIIYGMQYLGTHPNGWHVGRTRDTMPSSLAFLAIEHPEVHFTILSGSDSKLQELNTLALSFPNVSLAGAWWNNFYPATLRQMWRLRLEMVPAAKLSAFISDAYCVEWCYARLRETKDVLADVLSDMVEEGYYSLSQAVEIAKRLFFDTPNELYFGGSL